MWFLFGLFGLIVGSFLNVIVVRHGVMSLRGRSECMSCRAQIPWYDNIPVLSWMALRGRCRRCTSRISIQYPLVELCTGILFSLVGAAPAAMTVKIATLPLIALLIAIAVYDMRHTIIPDAWAYLFGGGALALQFLTPPVSMLEILLLFTSGPLAAAPLYAL